MSSGKQNVTHSFHKLLAYCELISVSSEKVSSPDSQTEAG